MATITRTFTRADTNFPWILAIPPYDQVFLGTDMANTVQPYQQFVASQPGREGNPVLTFSADNLTCVSVQTFDTLANAQAFIAAVDNGKDPRVIAQRQLAYRMYSDNNVRPYSIGVKVSE